MDSSPSSSDTVTGEGVRGNEWAEMELVATAMPSHFGISLLSLVPVSLPED